MATKAEIAIMVMQKLTKLAPGETITTDDSALIQAKYDSFYHILAAQNLVSWGSTDDIPIQAEIPVVGLLAKECLNEFTIPARIAQDLLINEQNYKNILKMYEYQYYVPHTEAVYY